MYFYFYDKQTQDKKYEPLLVKVETRLIDLGLNGRVEKLSIFKNARDSIRDAVKRGAKTVVAVGDDRTFTTIVNMVATHDLTLGFIPVEPGVFSRLLGIPVGEAACDVLSKRLYQTLDLGCIQDFYFVGAAVGETKALTTLRCDDAYTVTVPPHTQMQFANIGDVFNENAAKENSADGALRIHLHTSAGASGWFRRQQTPSSDSVFRAHTIAVTSGSTDLTLQADHGPTFHAPCTLTVAPQAVKVIVGRDRLF